MRQPRRFHISSRPIVLCLGLLLIAPLSIVACGDETQDDSILDSRNDENDNNQTPNQNQDPGYEAGLLDGYWELTWADDGEHFSSFTIVHNLDDDILSGTFNSVGAGEGDIRTINFEPDVTADEDRTPGRMTAEWRPYPGDPDINEEYTITAAYFEADTEDEMIGEISATVGFDIRMFNMVRAEPPEPHGDEEGDD
jgi:hypothetical protein